jgi:hypothetical protein
MPNGLVRVSWAPASNAACRSGSVGQVSSRMEAPAAWRNAWIASITPGRLRSRMISSGC